MEYQFPEFIYLRPVFIGFIIILLVLLFGVIFLNKNIVNLFSVVSITFICTSVSAITLYSSGYIVDEYNLAGDPISFYMFFVILVLAFLNLIIFMTRYKKSML
ncbi:hypothetical protein [Psychrobacillus sp. FJAT-21963]|uniref:hypothetical protein n=1 Tax=Psychrobacillus sp. FJAT-21963 TaxID=1712028 RepID=UPI0006FD0A94|nr:hypothetical protein [Psychrobacillus sp. FJAT-21963]KQL35982.1 hypothetical protein AN959_08870 [Psychrobacillus sp. FJAT-21963]